MFTFVHGGVVGYCVSQNATPVLIQQKWCTIDQINTLRFLLPSFDWWLFRVTLLLAFGFLPQNFGRWRGAMNHSFVILFMQIQWWGYHEVVGTLKPKRIYLNLLHSKIVGGCKNFRCQHWRLSHLVKLLLPNILLLKLHLSVKIVYVSRNNPELRTNRL